MARDQIVMLLRKCFFHTCLGEGPFYCDTDWEEYDGHCYIHNTQALKWQDAQVYTAFQGFVYSSFFTYKFHHEG